MKKTILIDGKPIVFKGGARIHKLYKKLLGRNFASDVEEILKVKELNIDPLTSPLEDLKKVDFDKLFSICWIFARNADKSIPRPDQWEREFDSFPVIYVIIGLGDLIERSVRKEVV
jgi:hypothetical protein